MRLYSTPQSFVDGEVSLLAIAETILASSVSAYIAFRYDTLLHLAVGAFVAPLLMLRTAESTDMALEEAVRLTGLVERSVRRWIFAVADRQRTLGQYLGFFAYPILALYIRVRSTALSACRRPYNTFQQSPGNCWPDRRCSCEDAGPGIPR